jgi:hypothetical protein
MGHLRYNQISKTEANQVITEFVPPGNGQFNSITEAFRACSKIVTPDSKTYYNVNHKSAIDFLSCYVELKRRKASNITYDKRIHRVIYKLNGVSNHRILKGSALADGEKKALNVALANNQAQNPSKNAGSILTTAVRTGDNDTLQQTCKQVKTASAVPWRSSGSTSPSNESHLTSPTSPRRREQTSNNDHQPSKSEPTSPGRRRYEPTRNYRPVDDQAPIQPANTERNVSKCWRQSEEKVGQITAVNKVNLLEEAGESKEVSKPPREFSDLLEINQPNEISQPKTIELANNNCQTTSKRRRRGRRQRRSKTDKSPADRKTLPPGFSVLLQSENLVRRDGRLVREPITIRCSLPDPKQTPYSGCRFWVAAPPASALPIPSFFTLENQHADPSAEEDSGYESDIDTNTNSGEATDEDTTASSVSGEHESEDEKPEDPLLPLRVKIAKEMRSTILDPSDPWDDDRIELFLDLLTTVGKEDLEIALVEINDQRCRKSLADTVEFHNGNVLGH